ncbi:chitin deacetylase [Cristinia sonorae]|uniref:chitin deacetylase n=1 Tax=Cristinia sonorae TaxID=1940300 RepID=A0A8K0UX07_9AGAR|nr:chitin deacetylase [Cristinia sonorae]
MLSLRLLSALACGFSLAAAAIVPHDNHDHAPTPTRLPTQWYHSEDHHAHALFKRAPSDGANYPALGSPEWRAPYPQSTPDPNALPKQWVDALNAAVAAGKIPNIPPTTSTGNNNPVYPNGMDPMSDQVCSTTYKCRKNRDVMWDAPDGTFAISFDDGPQPASNRLYDFLQDHNEKATHFFIGVNILNNPNEFRTAFEVLEDDIAVHTWTHPHMTTLSNLDLLGQFGWTMDIIHKSTGGRLPRYWRPPYGDSDNRVVAIAKEVFGLTTVIWNQDTSDWSIPSGGTTNEAVQKSMTQWLTGPKKPGLMVLEHELYNQTVQAFIDAYPLIKSNGWKTISVAQINGDSYQNSHDSDSAVQRVDGIFVNAPLPSSSSSSSSKSLSSSTTSSGSTSFGSTTSSMSTTSAGTSLPASPTPPGTSLQQGNGAVPLFGASATTVVAGFFVVLSSLILC